VIYNITQKQAIRNTGQDRARDITSLDIIDVHPKGPYLNTLKRYHIYKNRQEGLLLNKTKYDIYNPISDVIS
jgi:hypothetical protein